MGTESSGGEATVFKKHIGFEAQTQVRCPAKTLVIKQGNARGDNLGKRVNPRVSGEGYQYKSLEG